MSLASFQEDISHPAFVRVTVDAELADDMLLFHRRGTIKRKPVYMYAQMIGGDSRPRYVTDRLIIPGRNSSHASAMKSPLFMSADVTAPIEPGICARSEVTIKAGESNTLLFVMGLAKSKEQAISDCRELSSTTIEQVRVYMGKVYERFAIYEFVRRKSRVIRKNGGVRAAKNS